MRLTGGTHLGWLGSGWLNNAGLDWTGDRNHRPLVVPHHQAEAEAEAEAEAAIRFPHSLAAAARQISPASPPRLRCSILTHLISSPSASPASQLHRLISAAAASGVSPAATPAFAVEEYLVSTCGLTRAQALKGSTKLSHLKSPAKPDAVLALLAGADIAAVVAKDPQLLCAKEEKTLGPNVVGLTGLGLSPSEIARLVSLGPDKFRRRSIVSTLEYCLPLFGSSHNLLRAARCNAALLDLNPERTAKPNVTLLQECGLGACDIAKLCRNSPWLLTTNLQRLRSMLALAEGLGVPRGSGMFRQALRAVGLQSEETITAKVEFLKKTFRLSDAEVRSALSKSPMVLTRSKDMLQHVSEFLISEVGLEPTYIAHLSVMLTYSLEGRLRPRYDVLKFLKENRLLKRDLGYSTVFKETEKIFRDKFICPHKGCTTPRRRL